MSYTMTGVVTGAAITGFTSPTYTLTVDSAVNDNARKSIVTALGGTQAGVSVHAVSSPFAVTVTRPKQLKTLGRANLNGLIANVGSNAYRGLIEKGVIPLAGQPYKTAKFRWEFEIPSGSELADAPNIKGLFSFAGGFLNSNAIGMYDTATNASL